MCVCVCVLQLEKWFPLQGERAQSLKVFNVRMLGFKNKIEMRRDRTTTDLSIYNKVITFSTYYMYTTSPQTLYQRHIQFSIIVALPCMFPSNLHARLSIGGK